MKYISFVYSSVVSFLTGALLVFLLWGAFILTLSTLTQVLLAMFGPPPYTAATSRTLEVLGIPIVAVLAVATLCAGVFIWRRLMRLVTQLRYYPANEYTMELAGFAAFLALAPSYRIWPSAFFVP